MPIGYYIKYRHLSDGGNNGSIYKAVFCYIILHYHSFSDPTVVITVLQYFISKTITDGERREGVLEKYNLAMQITMLGGRKKTDLFGDHQ